MATANTDQVAITIDDDEIDESADSIIQVSVTSSSSTSSLLSSSPPPLSLSSTSSSSTIANIESEQEPDYIRYDEPAVCRTKGRPSGAKNKFRKRQKIFENSTRRELSGFERMSELSSAQTQMILDSQLSEATMTPDATMMSEASTRSDRLLARPPRRRPNKAPSGVPESMLSTFHVD